MRKGCICARIAWDSHSGGWILGFAGNGIVHAQHDMCLLSFIPALELDIPARDINGTTGRITLLFIVFFSPHIRRAAAAISIRPAIFKHNIIIEPPGGQVEVSFQILSFHVITLIFPNPQSLLSSILFDDVLIWGLPARYRHGLCASFSRGGKSRYRHTRTNRGLNSQY